MFAWMVLYFSTMVMPSLQTHAHATNIDFLALKFRNFQLKNFDIFLTEWLLPVDWQQRFYVKMAAAS